MGVLVKLPNGKKVYIVYDFADRKLARKLKKQLMEMTMDMYGIREEMYGK